MIIREIISGIKLLFNKGPESDDGVLTNKYIYHLMKTIRSMLLYEKLRDPLFNYRLSLQTLECIELIPTEKNECSEKLDSGCKWLKSKNPLPETINDIITKVYNDRGDKYTRVFSESSKSFKRYNFRKTEQYKYLIKNNHLYVTDLNSPKWIKIEALFYDEEIVKTNCGKCECNLMDTEFSLDNRLIKKMKDIIYEEVLKVYPYMKRDEINNADLDDEQVNTQKRK